MEVLLLESLVRLGRVRGLHELGLVLLWVASLLELDLLSHGQVQPDQWVGRFEHLEGQQYLCRLL